MKRKVWMPVSIALTTVVLALAGWSLIQLRPYGTAHVTLTQTPCAWSRNCPAFTYDLFGDGTVVYQHDANPARNPAIIYHIGTLRAALTLWRLDHSRFNGPPIIGAGGIDTPSCSITYRNLGKTFENGCGDLDAVRAAKAAPDLLPELKAVRLDARNRDYAPSLPAGIKAVAYTPASGHTVEAIFWKRQPHDAPPTR